MGNFKHLLAMLSDTQPAEVRLTVPRLAAVSLLEVFKDILPEYQIKHVEEDGIQCKICSIN
jgi:nucleolar complex protein 3